ncbi:MAG: EthD domain-containing protein [Rhodobacter sp.]|nr:EthD domain-containing protein [Rhodobacter sp.]
MLERFAITKARPGMSRAEFLDYWMNTHAPLVARIPEYWEFTERYIQNETLEIDAFGIPKPDYEGVMETWQRANHGHPERLFSDTRLYKEKVAHDGPNFADLGNCTVMEAEPNVIIDGPRTGFKMFSFNKRRPDISHDQFVAHWGGPHADIVRSEPGIHSCFHRYVQHYVTPGTEKRFNGAPSPFQFDGILELWFDAPEDLERLFTSRAYREKLHPDEDNFVQRGASLRFLLKEIEITPETGRSAD